MKRVLDLLRREPARPVAGGDSQFFFSTAFVDQGLDAQALVPWEARAVEVGARRLPVSQGAHLLQRLWGRDRFMSRLSTQGLARLERYFEYAQVPAERDLIRQDEYSNFMVVLLSGAVAVDRRQPWGEQVRLAEVVPGDMLGEMSLLDSGMRFSHCLTLVDCEVAVLDPQALDEMMAQDPALAAGLVALLARKLSLRLRAITERMSETRASR